MDAELPVDEKMWMGQLYSLHYLCVQVPTD